MIIRRFTFTVCALFVFMFALYCEKMLLYHKVVPRETMVDDTPTLPRGVSQNGTVMLSEIATTPPAPVGQKIPNHVRTLRAYISSDEKGGVALYLESASPHRYYCVFGAFVLAAASPTLRWVDNHTLQFYVTRGDGVLVPALFDVRDITVVFSQEYSGAEITL
jgi:hypothetical protein